MNNYKEIFEDSDKKALNSLIATKILDLMDKLRLNASENAKRRWVWELIQNAKDVAYDDQRVEVEIDLVQIKDTKKISFKHNGKPFSVDNITFLIKQVSTKERDVKKQEDDHKTTGKFGTGFLTTHLLSPKVNVVGIVKEPHLDYRQFELPLDRRGRSTDEIIESVNKSIKVRDTLDTQVELLDFNKNNYNTSFEYELDQQGFEVAETGLQDLHTSIPYTLIFNSDLKSVSVKNENTSYELTKSIDLTDEIKISTINKIVNDKANEIFIVSLNRNNTTIAVEIINKDGEFYIEEFHQNLPKLFCDFPLIGTNDFIIPIVINNPDFNPTEPRDGVWLTDHNNEPKILDNKTYLQEARDLYSILLDFASLNNWKNLYHLAKFNIPEDKDWLSKDWIEDNFKKPIFKKFKSTPVVDTVNGERLPIEIGSGAFIDFPYHMNNVTREEIWECCNIKNHFILPIKNDIHNWYKVIKEEKYFLRIGTIAEWIEKQGSLAVLSDKIGKDIDDTLSWLNAFQELLGSDKNSLNKLKNNELKIIPNQKGDFCYLKELAFDKGIEEELKNVLEILGVDIRAKLAHSRISNRNSKDNSVIWYYSKRETLASIINQINQIIDNGENYHSISKACDYLCSCYSEDQNSLEIINELYSFCSDVFEMPERRVLKFSSGYIWRSARKIQIDRLLNFIAGCKNVEMLKYKLKKNKDETLIWLNEIVEFLIKLNLPSKLNKEEVPILPNQKGDFCIKDDLFLDSGDIYEELKDIITSLGIDIRSELLDKNIFLRLPKSRTRTNVFVSTEISTLITPKFSEFPRSTETKEVFKTLYLWFSKHKLEAENLFSTLYSNKHKLYDDDEIAANMEKAEKLDELLEEFNIRSFSDLKQRLLDKDLNKKTVKPVKIEDLITSLGITSNDDLQKAIKEYEGTDIGDALVHTSNSFNFSYVFQIIERAKVNVKNSLKNKNEYNIENWQEESMTVINGVLKNGIPTKIVIRPSDGGQIIIFYQSEFDALEDPNTELWYDNNTIQGRYSLGTLLKRANISRMPL